jgi:predicted deacylase
MTHQLFEGIFAHGDYVIDYHEGGRDFMAKYLIVAGGTEGDDSIVTRSRQMAVWFGHGVPAVVSRPMDVKRRLGFTGTLNGACGSRGIPSLGAELGGAGRVWEEFVSLGVAGTRNVMIGLGLLNGKMVDVDRPQVFCGRRQWVRPKRSGLLIPADGIELGDTIEAGQLMAVIQDPFGDVVEEVRAPYRCVLYDTRHSAVVYPGDWTYSCGEVV